MIGTVISGRGNKRIVIERPRNMGFSKALAASIKKYLRLDGHMQDQPARTGPYGQQTAK